MSYRDDVESFVRLWRSRRSAKAVAKILGLKKISVENRVSRYRRLGIYLPRAIPERRPWITQEFVAYLNGIAGKQ